MSQSLPIFVYGTLLGGFDNHKAYIDPYPHRVLPAKTKGILYHLAQGYPAIVRDGREEWIYGELLMFPDDVYTEVLNALDQLEEYFGPNDKRNEYEREVAEVTLITTGEICSAYAYVMRGEKELNAIKNGIHLSHGSWRKWMEEQATN